MTGTGTSVATDVAVWLLYTCSRRPECARAAVVVRTCTVLRTGSTTTTVPRSSTTKKRTKFSSTICAQLIFTMRRIFKPHKQKNETAVVVRILREQAN